MRRLGARKIVQLSVTQVLSSASRMITRALTGVMPECKVSPDHHWEWPKKQQKEKKMIASILMKIK